MTSIRNPVRGPARAQRLPCLVLWTVALTAACAGRGLPASADPVTAAAAIDRTAPDQPLQAVFDWVILDGGARFTGSGVARIAPPYRARLDLFGPRGDGYLSAAAIGDEIRLPPGTPSVPLPPPALMWAVLGVVSPPSAAVLVGTRVEDDRTELHYDVDGSRLRYTLVAGRVRSARWQGGGRQMALELTGSAEHGLPRSALYRDASGGTEMKLDLEKVDHVESFPPDTWIPDA